MSYTLMPYRSYGESAGVLTDIHLQNQIDAVVRILQGQCADTPVPDMWRGYSYQLVLFGLRMTHEATIERRLRWPRWQAIAPYVSATQNGTHKMPPWWGDSWVHRSHRSRLLGWRESHYADYFPGNPMHMPTIWPYLTDEDSRGYKLTLSKRDIFLVDRGNYRLPAGLRWDNARGELLPS